MLIVTHIPKTGGTSFRDYLTRTLGGRLHVVYPNLPAQAAWWRRLLARAQGLSVPWGTACIIGHFKATRFDKEFPQALHAAWFRDPVQRTLSHFHHTQRNAGPAAKLNLAPGFTLADFLSKTAMHDLQTSKLRGKRLADFAFVGLTERFDLSLQLFARRFGWPEPEVSPRKNVNQSRKGGAYTVDDDSLRLILECNTRDVELYREAQERFAELCRAHGLDAARAA